MTSGVASFRASSGEIGSPDRIRTRPLAKLLLVALTAKAGGKELHEVDPDKVKRLRFPFADMSWTTLWTHLETIPFPVTIDRSAGRQLRELSLLLMTGVDLRDDKTVQKMMDATKLELPRTRKR